MKMEIRYDGRLVYEGIPRQTMETNPELRVCPTLISRENDRESGRPRVRLMRQGALGIYRLSSDQRSADVCATKPRARRCERGRKRG